MQRVAHQQTELHAHEKQAEQQSSERQYVTSAWR
jgi:hypothetical protein